MVLGPPATRTECYLAAILDELRALRVAVEDVRPEPAVGQAVPVEGVSGQLERMPLPGSERPPTKRTRQRARATS